MRNHDLELLDQEARENEYFLRKLLSDEATFHVNRNFDLQNYRLKSFVFGFYKLLNKLKIIIS